MMLPERLRDLTCDLLLFHHRHEVRLDADARIRTPSDRLAGHVAQIALFCLAVREALRPMLRRDQKRRLTSCEALTGLIHAKLWP